MNDIAVDHAAAGAYVITSSRTTPNSTVKSTWYPSRGVTHMYNFQGNIDNAVWDNYAYTDDQPYKVVIDRDGYLRFKGSDIYAAEPILLECLGVN